MKKLLFVAVLFIFIGCDIREVAPPEEYSRVIEIKMSQKEIYSNVINWATSNFVGSNQQIILNDKENGIISLSGYISNLWGGMIYGKFILKIQIKDNKYRLIIVGSNAYTISYGREVLTYYNEDALEAQNLYFENLFSQIEKSINNKKSDW